MKRVYDFLKKAETYYLATVEGNQPRVRPFGTVNEKSMLDAYPNLRGMYHENDGNTQVFYMKNATATISSFTSKPVVIEF